MKNPFAESFKKKNIKRSFENETTEHLFYFGKEYVRIKFILIKLI